jgi:hypothetical protein
LVSTVIAPAPDLAQERAGVPDQATVTTARDTTIKHEDGEYKGVVVNGVPNGRGIYKAPDFGYEVKGEFKDGQPSGLCVQKWDSGEMFQGTMKNGYRVRGTYTFKNGTKWTGNFDDENRPVIGWEKAKELAK